MGKGVGMKCSLCKRSLQSYEVDSGYCIKACLPIDGDDKKIDFQQLCLNCATQISYDDIGWVIQEVKDRHGLEKDDL